MVLPVTDDIEVPLADGMMEDGGGGVDLSSDILIVIFSLICVSQKFDISCSCLGYSVEIQLRPVFLSSRRNHCCYEFPSKNILSVVGINFIANV